MSEMSRGVEGGSNPEESKEKLRRKFLNRWTALLGVLGVVLTVKFGFEGKRKADELKEKVAQDLHLDEKDLPPGEKDIQDGLEAIEHLKDVLEVAAEGEYMVLSVGGESEGPKIVSTKVVRQNPMELIVDQLDANGKAVSTIRYDLSYPDEETATDENYKAVQDYFKSDCAGWTVERLNQWEYKAIMENHGDDGELHYLRIRAEEDGSYTVDSLTGLEDERNIGNLGEIAGVLKDKEKILSLSQELQAGQISVQEFKEKLKEMGYLPTGM
jgi:hypothetical protein